MANHISNDLSTHACLSVWTKCPQMTTHSLSACTALNHIRTLWAGAVAVLLLLKRFGHSCFQSLRYNMLNVLSGDKSFCLTRWTWVLKRISWNHLDQQGKGSWNECSFPLNRVWLCLIIVLKNRLSNDILNWASKHTLTKRRHWLETYLVSKTIPFMLNPSYSLDTSFGSLLLFCDLYWGLQGLMFWF